jgi:hypothetical protein
VEPAPQGHCSRFAFCEQSANPERARSFIGDDYAAYRWSYDCAYLLIAESSGQRAAYPLGMFRILENERALKITRAVQTRRELKVTFEQCARLLKNQEQLLALVSWLGVW